MKKLFKVFAIALMAVTMLTAPASAEFRDMWAEVYSWDGTVNADGKMNLNRITSGVTFKVLQRNSDTAETLYYYNNDAMTSLTNPVSAANFASNTVCNDKVSFRVDPGEANDTYVDLIVTNTAGFYSAFVEDFTENTHAIVIDQRPSVKHTGVIWFNTSTTSEYGIGPYFLTDTLITDTRVEVVTTCAACTIDIGLLSTQASGDADGLRDGVLLTTAGFVADTGVITSGGTIDYTPDSTYGDLLYTIIAGSDQNSTDNMVNGGRSFLGHVVTASNATTLTYTEDSAATGDGYIYVEHIRLR